MTLSSGTKVGPYEILGTLGRGGMGEVYRASDTLLKREVAIKVLPEAFARDAERMRRFEREAQLLASLNHPNVASIYGVAEADGVRALVLELVEGPTLAQRIAQGALPLEEAFHVAGQIADGLEAAHDRGVVHRDLKPANVKLTNAGDAKILDFGLAKAVEGEPPRAEESVSPTLTRATQAGVLLGTAAYMSPEQAKGKPADRRADVWSFGVVLFEMLTGRRAFSGEDAAEVLAQVLTRDPDWSALPRGLPERVRQVLTRCLTKDPRQRLQAIGEARIALAEPGEAAPRERAPFGPTLAAGVIAGLALAWGLWAAWPRPSPARPPLMRLHVDIGASTSIKTNTLEEGQGAVLSPDGSLLAFVAESSPGALPQLFVRRLEDLEAALLSGTEGARNPFFSPDGRWIGFFTEGKLKKVAVTGGGALTVSEATGPALGTTGGNWAPDGSIVFAQDYGTSVGLMRVTSVGGKPEPLFGEAPSAGQSMRWPQVLPSGRAILYSFSTAGSLDWGIAVQTLPAGPRKVVVRDGYHGRYLPSGHLVYIQDAALFAVPFDLDRLEATGPPARAITGVSSSSTTAGAQFACSDRGTLVYVPATTPESTIQWVHRSGKRETLRDAPRDYRSLRFSPDGRALAMDIIERGERDVWAYEWERDRFTRLTFDPAPDSQPVWTPDGRRIVFSSTRADKRTRNLYWLRADGAGDPERLTESDRAQWAGSWHPSGKFLAYSEISLRTPRPDIMILPFEGSEELGWKPGKPTAFTDSPFVENYPSFSPDGRWLAYMSNETGRFEVYVRPFPGKGGRWQVSTDGGMYPTWSRTRREVVYRAGDQRIRFVPYSVIGDEFRAEKPRPWSEERFPAPPNAFYMDLHPDGERVAAAVPAQSPDVQLDKVVFVLDFFDYLRQVAPARR